MTSNEQIIDQLYASAEGASQDMEKFVSLFSADGYLYDASSQKRFYGKDRGDYIAWFNSVLPDVHRERFNTYVSGDVIVVELAIRGTHKGELAFGNTKLAPTGRSVDMPACDVFHLENGKVKSFHCYTATAVMMQQLTAAD